MKEDDDLGTESSRSAALRRDDTRRKRKKKTKKKGAGGGGGGGGSVRTADQVKSSEDLELEDEIDRSVREVNRILGSAPKQASSSSSRPPSLPCQHAGTPQSALRAVLAVEYRNLNPENEMKKIFGSRVVQAEMRHHRARGHHHHHHHGHHHGHHRTRVQPRSAHSVLAPRGNWPNPSRHGGGLSMRFVDSDAEGNQVGGNEKGGGREGGLLWARKNLCLLPFFSPP